MIDDEKLLRPPLVLEGLENRDETSVKMFLSSWVLQAENEEEAKKRFDNLLHWHLASAPKYPDKIAVHFAAQVDPNTGSKYASEVKVVDGKEQRVMIEDTELINRFIEWTKGLNEDSEVIRMARQYYNERDYYRQQAMAASLDNFCRQEMEKLGFSRDAAQALLSGLVGNLIYWNRDAPIEKFQDLVDGSNAKYKRAENTVTAKEYWEGFFAKNPSLRPKHIIYYNGDPTSAIYKFQQENGIGSADTSEVDGGLLGFDDNHVVDVENDPRSNLGHEELINLGNKIISEHYALR